MAYIHFQKCHIFKSALKKWDDREPQEKTWDQFKIHFREAHKSLRRTGALTINDTLNRDQLMNMVSESVLQTLQNLQPPPPPPPPPEEQPTSPESTDNQLTLIHTDTSLQSTNSIVSDVTL